MRRFLRLAYSLLYNHMAWTYSLAYWVVLAGQWLQAALLPAGSAAFSQC